MLAKILAKLQIRRENLSRCQTRLKQTVKEVTGAQKGRVMLIQRLSGHLHNQLIQTEIWSMCVMKWICNDFQHTGESKLKHASKAFRCVRVCEMDCSEVVMETSGSFKI